MSYNPAQALVVHQEALHITTTRIWDEAQREVQRGNSGHARRASEVASMLAQSDTYFVSSEIMATIQEVAHSIPGNWKLAPHLVPSHCGFLVFEEPLYARLHGMSEPVTIHALSWANTTIEGAPGLMLLWWARVPERYGIEVIPLGSMTWKFSAPIEHVIEVNTIIEQKLKSAPQDNEELAMFTASFFSFVGQRILVTSSQYAPRHIQRHTLRNSPIQPVVRVIELRKRDYPNQGTQGESERDYQCRWLVRRHWRNQWYPSLADHQPVLIEAYIKGPDDKPLKKPSADVFAVVR